MKIWREDYIPYEEDGETIKQGAPQAIYICIKLENQDDIDWVLTFNNEFLDDIRKLVNERRALKC